MKMLLALGLCLCFIGVSESSQVQPDCQRSEVRAVHLSGCLTLARQGDAHAQFLVGLRYYFRGLAHHFLNTSSIPDYVKSSYWWTKAAKQGYVPAQNNLGVMYWYGLGILKNVVRAYMWIHLAFINTEDIPDRAKYSKNLDLLRKTMTPSQLAEAQRRSKTCLASHYTEC